MQDTNQHDDEIVSFVVEAIDSVPELEALLLLWQHRPTAWTASDLARRLYVDPRQTRDILLDLTRKGLIAVSAGKPDSYCYKVESEARDGFMERLEETYRRQIIRISNLGKNYLD